MLDADGLLCAASILARRSLIAVFDDNGYYVALCFSSLLEGEMQMRGDAASHYFSQSVGYVRSPDVQNPELGIFLSQVSTLNHSFESDP